MRVGAIIAGVHRRDLNAFLPLGFRIGAAFQIQDDVLNLDAEERLYGKEIGGDIAEGKRTLIAIHALQAAEGRTRDRLAAIYAKPREAKAEEIAWVLTTMRRQGSIVFARMFRFGSHSAPGSFSNAGSTEPRGRRIGLFSRKCFNTWSNESYEATRSPIALTRRSDGQLAPEARRAAARDRPHRILGSSVGASLSEGPPRELHSGADGRRRLR